MWISLPTLLSKPPTRPFSPKIFLQIHHTSHSFSFSSCSLSSKAKPFNKLHYTRYFYGPTQKFFDAFPVKYCGFPVNGQNSNGLVHNRDEEEVKARGQSSMPERFRYLTKEAPDKPIRWPWLIVIAFILYAWRTVLWELSNWRRAVGAVGRFLGQFLKFVLAIVFHFIGNPVTSLIRELETVFYTIRAFYSGIVAYAPIPELTLIIMLTSAVLAVGEAAAPESVSSQPYLLTLAGMIGFAAVSNYISELFFLALLMSIFGYASVVEKRNYVSAALPVAVVLAAVGETWVRVTVTTSYLGLAIFHYATGTTSPKDSQGEGEDEGRTTGVKRQVPIPLLCAALAIGIRMAAKWAGYRHLTWMIV